MDMTTRAKTTRVNMESVIAVLKRFARGYAIAVRTAGIKPPKAPRARLKGARSTVELYITTKIAAAVTATPETKNISISPVMPPCPQPASPRIPSIGSTHPFASSGSQGITLKGSGSNHSQTVRSPIVEKEIRAGAPK